MFGTACDDASLQHVVSNAVLPRKVRCFSVPCWLNSLGLSFYVVRGIVTPLSNAFTGAGADWTRDLWEEREGKFLPRK